MNTRKLSRILMFVSALLLVPTLFLPIWRIDLQAPQYPEGLSVIIYSHTITGKPSLKIVNDLNHYVGMMKIEPEKLVEFKVLPFIFGFFIIFALVAGLLNRRRIILAWLVSYAIFAIIALADFWWWEYKYGHYLDPEAPLKIEPFQPPLIGGKDLMNFYVFSIPDVAGWLAILSGVLAFVAYILNKEG